MLGRLPSKIENILLGHLTATFVSVIMLVNFVSSRELFSPEGVSGCILCTNVERCNGLMVVVTC